MYKVFRRSATDNVLESVAQLPSSYSQEYEQNKWVAAPEGHGGFFCFEHLGDALRFLAGKSRIGFISPQGCEIWTVDALDAEPYNSAILHIAGLSQLVGRGGFYYLPVAVPGVDHQAFGKGLLDRLVAAM